VLLFLVCIFIDKGLCYSSVGKGLCYSSVGKGLCYSSVGKGLCYSSVDKGLCYSSVGAVVLGLYIPLPNTIENICNRIQSSASCFVLGEGGCVFWGFCFVYSTSIQTFLFLLLL
jgi:hypothetical protein